jgi:retron-type reverse transcriptase
MSLIIPPFDNIYSIENLYSAWHKVSRGKSKKHSVIAFYRNLDANLASIAFDLRSGSYLPGPYNHFVIKDPKERIISASPLRDRIVQHALMNGYNPVFERQLIYGSYACRLHKGTQKAVLRAFHFAKSRYSPPPGFFLKMDVRKYFDSIDHEVLKNLLAKIVKEKKALALFYAIIDSHTSAPEKGIPIGNLTSQYFANQYLSPFDHYLKEKWQAKRYLRYMDDMLLFDRDKSRLKELYHASVSYTANELHLQLKPMVLSSLHNGAPFLGYLIKPQGIYLRKTSKTRYRKRFAEIEHYRVRGLLSEQEAGRRMESVTAHLDLARSRHFRNTVIGRVLGV